MSRVAHLACVLIGYFLGAAFGWAAGRAQAAQSHRKEAVEAGVAEYVVNPKTGDTAFTYKKSLEK